MTSLAQRTGAYNYFEDFRPGQVLAHARGKTITALENVLFTNLVLNTAETHFNDDLGRVLGRPGAVVYGGVTFSIVLGLAAQDCCENALAELGLDKVKLTTPVFHGDTVYAYSEVLEVADSDQADAGLVTFRHFGFNQRDELVTQVDRKVLLKRRSHWGSR